MRAKTITLEPTREHELVAPEARHRLVFGGSNMDTVIHLSDLELLGLRSVVERYDPSTRRVVES